MILQVPRYPTGSVTSFAIRRMPMFCSSSSARAPKSRTFLLACRLVVCLGKSNRTSAHKLTSFPLRPQVCLTRSWACGSCMESAASTGMVVRGSSSTLLCPRPETLEADRARARMRCERRWDAVGCPRAASSVSESESDNRRRSEHCVRPPPKCHRDLTVLWGSLRAPANAMTPFYRGVSDLGCGRGHDRRRGQISWSLTPRYRH